LFAFKLNAKSNDEKNTNNAGDPPKLKTFHFAKLFISRIKGKKKKKKKKTPERKKEKDSIVDNLQMEVEEERVVVVVVVWECNTT
jgi:hypothetical protein